MKKILIYLFLLNINLSYAHNIAVDIGHYLEAPGAISSFGKTEFSYNQIMANSIVEKLEFSNAIKKIGYDGDLKDLEYRSSLASDSDLLVSIHHDSVHLEDIKTWEYEGNNYYYNDEVRGFGIFVSSKNIQFEKSLVCANKVAKKLIVAGFIPNYYHSINHNGIKREILIKGLPVYKYDNLILLRSSKAPAILIEVGVIVNRIEAKEILEDNFRERFSKAVAKGVNECLNE